MVNVIPNNDEREHIRSADCWCNPEVEWANPETGMPYAAGPLIGHNSADCREYGEIDGMAIEPGKNWAVIRE